MTMIPFDAVMAAPGFALGLRAHAEALTEIVFLPPQPERPPTSPLVAEGVRQLQAYFRDAAFQFDLPLAATGSPFRRRVWRAIQRIPSGETRSYGQLARELVSSPRAVGQACGDNPLPIIVPCHRVLASGGKLGGFAHTQDTVLLDIKRWLLAHEHRT